MPSGSAMAAAEEEDDARTAKGVHDALVKADLAATSRVAAEDRTERDEGIGGKAALPAFELEGCAVLAQ